MRTTYGVNSPDVIHETIEGEVVVIDLRSGTYYSLREAGAIVWRALERGADEEEILAELERHDDGTLDEMRDATRRLLDELESEGLVRVEESAGAGGGAIGSTNNAARMPFRPPVLEKHTDMQDLILLDPVHEVGARGWPHAAGVDE